MFRSLRTISWLVACFLAFTTFSAHSSASTPAGTLRGFDTREAGTPGPAQRALVLGGGGPTALAWEVGILKGLQDAGIDLTQADLLVGNSAGASLAAQLRSGRSVDDIYHTIVEPPTGTTPNPDCSQAAVDQGYVGRIQRLVATAPEPTLAMRLEVGQLALAAPTAIPEEKYLSCIASSAPNAWPSMPLKIASVDVSDGSVRLFDSTQGVPIAQALAASNASPGIVAPITIGDQRYMDGYAYGTHIDGAMGSSVIIALTPTQPLRAMRELDLVRAAGSEAMDVAPDAASRDAIGPNIQDRSRMKPTAEAGRQQAAAVVADVQKLWSLVR
jgi:NTE family protein